MDTSTDARARVYAFKSILVLLLLFFLIICFNIYVQANLASKPEKSEVEIIKPFRITQKHTQTKNDVIRYAPSMNVCARDAGRSGGDKVI